MKASTTPSLILYFVSCVFFVVFSIMREPMLVLLSKSMIIPAIFMYYLIKNNYKFEWISALCLLLSFAGDVYILLDFEDYLTSSIWCFFGVYVLMIYYVLEDRNKVTFAKKDFFPIVLLIVFFGYLLVTVLDMQFKKTQADFYIFVTYGISLAILSCLAVSNYIAKGSYAFLQLALTVTCFILSDVFYSINHFYYSLPVFEVITISGQVLSYYFMVNYFLLRKKVVNKTADTIFDV